jgi:puromycin-sensitive aminopeptidase
MRLYMRRHGDGNAAARDLWDALAEASGQPVREVAEEWVDREGFPVVEVALEGRRLLLKQRRFRARGPVDESPWPIPMVLRYIDDAGEHSQRFLFRESEASVELAPNGGIALVCANAAASGFYRVHYSDALGSQLLDHHELLRPVERVAFLSDLWGLAVAGTLSVTHFLDAITPLAEEREEAVLAEAATRLAYLSTRVLDAEGLKALARLVCELFGPAFEAAGWDASPQERESSRQRRAELLRLVGIVGRSSAVAAEAARRVDEYLVSETNHLEPNLLDTATLLAARAADADRFQALIRGSREASDPQGRRRYRSVLAAVEDPGLQDKALALALTDTIPGPDLFRFFSVAFSNPETRDAAWRFYSEHWDKISARTGGMSMLGYLVEFLQSLGSDYAKSVHDFFAGVSVPKAEKILTQTVEVLEVDRQFAQRARPEALAWLGSRRSN